jgi:hypothetical protein
MSEDTSEPTRGKKKGKKKVSKLTPAGEGEEPQAYRYEILENVAGRDVQGEVEVRRRDPDYVTHNIEAEDDGEFTLFFVFRK